MSIFHSPNPLIEADLSNLSISSNPLTKTSPKSRRLTTILTKNKASTSSTPKMGIRTNPSSQSPRSQSTTRSPAAPVKLSIIDEQTNISTPSTSQPPPTSSTDSTIPHQDTSQDHDHTPVNTSRSPSPTTPGLETSPSSSTEIAFSFVHPLLEYNKHFMHFTIPFSDLIDNANPPAFVSGWRMHLIQIALLGMKRMFDAMNIPEPYHHRIATCFSSTEQVHQHLFFAVLDRVLHDNITHDRVH